MLTALKRTFGFINTHPLASKNLITAYWRFFCWQVECRINSKLIVKSFIGNTKFLARRGLTGITGNIYAGLHEFSDMGFLLHFLRPNDTFIDVGANVGSYTLLASSFIGAKSIAFEPAPTTFNLLTQNIALNDSQNVVQLHNKALGGSKSSLRFSTQYDTVNHIIAEGEIDSTAVSIDVDLLDEYIDETVSLLKIDVEGFETEVLKGAKQLLASSNLKAIIIELNGSGARYGYKELNIHQELTSKGYQPYQYEPFQRKLTALASFGAHNTIYIKDLPTVLERCKNARLIEIFGLSF